MSQARTPTLVRQIALMNQKGGVGKTTTTCTLAAAFARAGRSTLVVDLDPQAHATLHLGVDPNELQHSVYDLFHDPNADASGIVKNIAPNLDLLPSQTDLAAIETELATAPERQKRLEKALLKLNPPEAPKYEFVLFDCPPSLGLLTINGLAAAREVLIPMQAHFLALQGVGKLLETVALVAKAVNPRLKVSGVILCMHDSSSSHSKEVVADLDGFFEQQRTLDLPWKKARVYRPAVRRNIKLAECPSFGKTIFEYAPAAPGAEDYRQLADALLKEWDLMLAKREAGEQKAEAPVVEIPAKKIAESAAATNAGVGA